MPAASSCFAIESKLMDFAPAAYAASAALSHRASAALAPAAPGCRLVATLTMQPPMTLMPVTSAEVPITLSTARAASTHPLAPPATAFAVVDAPAAPVVGVAVAPAVTVVGVAAVEGAAVEEAAIETGTVGAAVLLVDAEEPHAASSSTSDTPAMTQRRFG